MKRRFAVALLALLFAMQTNALPMTPDPIPRQVGRQLATRTVELVEADGLLPRRQAEYEIAKADLLSLAGQQSDLIDRNELFNKIDVMLRTLDVDGHSFIISPERNRLQQQSPVSDTPQPPSLKLIQTARGSVLHWTPLQIVSRTKEARAAYIQRFFAEASALHGLQDTCGLVVDLTEQTGGNAWPPYIEMRMLFSSGNQALLVDRNGTRKPLVDAVRLAELEHAAVDAPVNPFTSFAHLPFAVVVGEHTASAGEMLLVALLGEGARVQTFGHASHGLSTSNRSYEMVDGSLLVLTEHRYAIGEQPVIRGKIRPEQPADLDEPLGNH